MPELTFLCPQCQQQIACDAAWAGQPVQCPLCQATVTVPGATASSPATGPQPRLSLSRPGQHGQSERAKPVYRQIDLVSQPKRNPLVPWLAGLAGAAILGVGGYFAYQQWLQPKETADTPATPSSGQAAGDANQPAAAEAAPAEAGQQSPLNPPTWTLDLATATIPKGKLNGSVAGTNFVPETARLDFVGTAYLLTLSQGTPVSPDKEIRVFLRPKAGQIVTNATWEISKEMKGAGVPQVVKRWKVNPRFAPQQKSFSTGYAMKLELRPAGPDTVAGRIFLALPDPEQSVVAGAFQAAFSATVGAAPAATPTPAAPPQEMPLNPEYQKRYGIQR